jgi:hypothetical protein
LAYLPSDTTYHPPLTKGQGSIAGKALIKVTNMPAVNMLIVAVPKTGTMSGSTTLRPDLWNLQYSDTVGSDGVYSIKNLPSGDYWVYARGGEYVMQFFPQNDFPENASTIHVDSLAKTNIDFFARPGGKIEGRVVTSSGAPLSGIAVYANFADHDMRQMAISGANGEFSLSGLNTGRWYLNAESQGYFMETNQNKTEFLVQEPMATTGATITLKKGGFLAGTYSSSKASDSGADSTASQSFEIALFSDTVFNHAPGSGTATLYENNTVGARIVTPGAYASNVCPAGNWFVLLKPLAPYIPRDGGSRIVQCPSYIFGGQGATELSLKATSPVRIVEGDTNRTVKAIFTVKGYSFYGVLLLDNPTAVKWAHVDACIKDGAFMIPISHGYITPGDSLFQLAGLIPGTQYFLRAEADGSPSQYWSPDGKMSAEPATPYVLNPTSFTRPVVRMQKTPSGYYNQFSPLSISTSLDPGNKLVFQWNIDNAIAADTMVLYSKDKAGNNTVLVSLPRVAGKTQYTWTETRDLVSGNFSYLVVAKGSKYTTRSYGYAPGTVSSATSSRDSLSLNVYGDRFGIFLNWSVGQKDTVHGNDTLYVYRKSGAEAWKLIMKQSGYNTGFTDKEFNKTTDIGTTFSYKIELTRAGAVVSRSAEKVFTVTAPFVASMANYLSVGSTETYKTIQSAVDAAANYDYISVLPGLYRESINLKGKIVQIEGQWRNGAPPVIDGMGGTAFTIPFCAPKYQWDNARISGIKIQNSLVGINAYMDVSVNQCLFVNITKQCVVASFDTAAMIRAAQADPFSDYRVDLNVRQCTFIGNGGGIAAQVASTGANDGSSTESSYGGLEQYMLVPALSFSSNARFENSIFADFPSPGIVETAGKFSSGLFTNCNFWNTTFDSTASSQVRVDRGFFKVNPMFQNTDYYFLPDSSSLYTLAGNNASVGYDERRKWSTGISNNEPRLSAVKNLRVSVTGASQISLVWEKLPADQNVNRYMVIRVPAVDSLFYVNQQSQWEMKIPDSIVFKVVDTMSTADTFLTDNTARMGVPYIYVVMGMTPSGQMGDVNLPFPPTLSAYTVKIPFPNAVSAMEATMLNFTTAALKWPASRDVSSYLVLRFKTKSGQLTSAPDSAAIRQMVAKKEYTSLDSFIVRDSSFIDSALALGQRYIYAIVSQDASGTHPPLEQLPLTYAFVSTDTDRFAGIEKIRLSGQTWHMVGPWGNGTLNFTGATNSIIYHWDDFKQPDKLLSQYASSKEMTGGTGYWFKSETDTLISLPADTSLASMYSALAATQSSRTIRLVKGQTGWNQVSSVFPFPIAPQWLASHPAYEWWQDGNQYIIATALKPWKAYWIYSDHDTSLPLGGLPMPGAVLAKRASSLSWELKVSLAGKTTGDPDNYCGVVTQALKKAPAVTSPEPPQAFDFPQLFFVQSKQQERLARLYKNASVGNSRRFEYAVGITPASEDMAVKVGGIESVPPEACVFWIQNGVAYDLRSAAEVSVAAHKECVYGYILVTYDSRDLALYTGKFELKKTYPNPFVRTTTIEFMVPYSFNANGMKMEGDLRTISLNVYNVQGRRVIDLLSGSVSVGLHRIIWNGNNTAGSPVANGFYIVRLAGEKIQHITKLFKLR